MSERVRLAIEQLSRSVTQNSAHVDETLRKAGVRPDRALVFTAAKYFEALTKLAEE